MNAMMKTNSDTDATVRFRLRNSRRSSNGWAGRNEYTTKLMTSSAPANMVVHTLVAVKVPVSGSDETPYRNRASPGESISMPRKSNDSDGSGLSLGSANAA